MLPTCSQIVVLSKSFRNNFKRFVATSNFLISENLSKSNSKWCFHKKLDIHLQLIQCSNFSSQDSFLGLSTVDRPINKPERLLRGLTPSSGCLKRWTRAWRCSRTSFRDSSAEPRSSITVRINGPWPWPWIVVSVHACYSNDPSSNPAGYRICSKRQKKRPGLAHL